MKRVPLKLFLLVALILTPMLGSCSSNEAWTFAATRAFYSDFRGVNVEEPVSSPEDGQRSAGPEVLLIFGFLLLPIAFDIVALPIALTRDWIVLT